MLIGHASVLFYGFQNNDFFFMETWQKTGFLNSHLVSFSSSCLFFAFRAKTHEKHVNQRVAVEREHKNSGILWGGGGEGGGGGGEGGGEEGEGGGWT